jgi:hypothetical protein
MSRLIRRTSTITFANILAKQPEGIQSSRIFGYSKGFFVIQISFLVFLSLWQISHRIFPSIEVMLLLVILMLVWKAQHRELLRDLLPFFILLLSFQSLRGFADDLHLADIHIGELIGYEKSLFSGVVPAHFLQSVVPDLPFSNIIGILSGIFYMSHFVVPVIIAMILWRQDKPRYWHFITGLIILSYLGFLTYIFYPAAPPWWATKYGYLIDQPVHLLVYTIPTGIEIAGPNPVAAMPSLHMAYPTYIVLYCIYTWGKNLFGYFSYRLE